MKPWFLISKKLVCPLQVGEEFLPQVEDFDYPGVSSTSETTMERELGRRIGAALYRAVVVKKELSPSTFLPS